MYEVMSIVFLGFQVIGIVTVAGIIYLKQKGYQLILFRVKDFEMSVGEITTKLQDAQDEIQKDKKDGED